MLVNLENICLNFDNKKILENINFSIQENEFTTIIGNNGAGKTSLLKIILQLVKPSLGTISFKNNLSLAYVPQKLHINQQMPLSVQDFLSLLIKSSKAEINSVLEKLSAMDLLNKQVSKLSGGELQRVLLARAMLKKPDLLVLDEPAQGVDVIGQNDLYKLINLVSKETNASVLMVSHDLHFVFASTNKVLCLDKSIVCSGSPSQIRDNESILKLFGENPDFAFYKHNHIHKHDNCLHNCSL